ncbi:MAG: hypothetical protein FJ404_03605 [Verrucomicrobia bacterium]|nr:hypothetical protein [Verrucomicrobiota bacterium]
MDPDVVGRAGLSQPAAHWMQNIMLRRRAGTDAPYQHHRQHRDAPLDARFSWSEVPVKSPCIPKCSLVWRRLASLPYRRRPVGPAGEEEGLSMLSTRLVPFVAPQDGQPAPRQTGLSA